MLAQQQDSSKALGSIGTALPSEWAMVTTSLACVLAWRPGKQVFQKIACHLAHDQTGGLNMVMIMPTQ